MLLPAAAPAPAIEDLDAPRLILRDGSAAAVRIAGLEDRTAIRAFFSNLSADARRQRFLAAGFPPDSVTDRFSAPADPATGLTLLATRRGEGCELVVAVASYLADRPHSAEVAFAVDDHFHGKGLSTLLLERLAARAALNGFTRFTATTFADNAAMLDVFRDSGFEMRSTSEAGAVDLELSLTGSAAAFKAAESRHRLATIESLKPLLTPRSVAVIGASADHVNVGRRILQALSSKHFTGRLYAVHPTATAIDGVPAVHTARDLPSGVDLAVVAVPQTGVLSIVDDCAAARIRALVVVSAGFAETGDGRELQTELVERVRGYGMRLVGPNCMGLLNTADSVSLNASFSPVVPPAGRVAFSSHSGALGIAILEMARDRQLGISQFISIGNHADVSSNDLLEYWESDPATSVILLYLESFGNPRRFSRIARRVARTKPIVTLKAARTRAGTRAAGSHTAALAAGDTATDALFHQSGVIRAETIDELFDVAVCLDSQPLPAGSRVAIITNAGGPGILASDACESAGLSVPEFSSALVERLKQFLPAAAGVKNPIDMVATAGPAAYRQAIEETLASGEVDAAIVMFTPIEPSNNEAVLDGIRTGILTARERGAHQPIVACLMTEMDPGRLTTGAERVPVYRFPENAVRALAQAAAYARWRRAPAGSYWTFDDIRPDEARETCRKAISERSGGWLSSDEVAHVLSAYGVPLVRSAMAHSAEEAAALAETIGFPAVAKVCSREIQHKTDVGGVRTNLMNGEDIRRAYREMAAAVRQAGHGEIEGVLLQPMVSGVETIVGVVDDQLFGPIVAFGMGGVNVEIMGDVGFRLAPLTDRDADDLISGIRGRRLLEGYRGRPRTDITALRTLLLRVSKLSADIQEIGEIDLNPVMALPDGQGCLVVDARIRVEKR